MTLMINQACPRVCRGTGAAQSQHLDELDTAALKLCLETCISRHACWRVFAASSFSAARDRVFRYLGNYISHIVLVGLSLGEHIAIPTLTRPWDDRYLLLGRKACAAAKLRNNTGLSAPPKW